MVAGTGNQLHEHHLCPEVVQVQAHTQDDDDTKNEHVLAAPLHLLGSVCHLITAVATGTTVLDCQPESIQEVQKHQTCQTDGCGNRIPISTKETTNHVVTLGTDKSHYVH